MTKKVKESDHWLTEWKCSKMFAARNFFLSSFNSADHPANWHFGGMLCIMQPGGRLYNNNFEVGEEKNDLDDF